MLPLASVMVCKEWNFMSGVGDMYLMFAVQHMVQAVVDTLRRKAWDEDLSDI